MQEKGYVIFVVFVCLLLIVLPRVPVLLRRNETGYRVEENFKKYARVVKILSFNR